MPEQNQIKIKVKEEDLKGSYSNLMQIIHSKDEFILDFFLISPPHGVLNSRVIMSPGHLKRLLKALQENIGNYEKKFGEIKMAESPKKEFVGFSPEK
jgi:hypothetical protein